MMKTLSVSALVFAAAVLAGAGADPVKESTSCSTDWTKISGRCFHYVPMTLTWVKAEKKCHDMGANLASVHSDEEYRSIQAMIMKLTKGDERVWLGGTDFQEEGNWLWSDGTPFNYRHCARFDNCREKQHCLQMNHGDKGWGDVQCSLKRPFICVKKPSTAA